MCGICFIIFTGKINKEDEEILNQINIHNLSFEDHKEDKENLSIPKNEDNSKFKLLIKKILR